MHTKESVIKIHQENSGYANHVFSGHEVDEIAQIEDTDNSLKLIMQGFEPTSMLDVEIYKRRTEYVWQLKSADSEMLRRGTNSAAKYRKAPEHTKLLQLLREADAIISRDRMGIVTVIGTSSTCHEAIAQISRRLAEDCFRAIVPVTNDQRRNPTEEAPAQEPPDEQPDQGDPPTDEPERDDPPTREPSVEEPE